MFAIDKHTQFIKSASKELGFDFCGIAKAVQLQDDARRLEDWLQKGLHGDMQYMENYFDLRINPNKLVPGAKSVITLLLNYFPEQQQTIAAPKIAKYAYGQDYHEVIKTKLKTLLQSIKENIGEVNGRGFVDSAPVLERAWAQKSGLGWTVNMQTLHTNFVTRHLFNVTVIARIKFITHVSNFRCPSAVGT